MTISKLTGQDDDANDYVDRLSAICQALRDVCAEIGVKPSSVQEYAECVKYQENFTPDIDENLIAQYRNYLKRQ